MQLLWINGGAGDVMIRALCWTLVHSLWQALLLALAAAVIIPLTKKTKPLHRYNLLTSLLIVFLSMAVSTFIYQCFQAGKPVAHSASSFFTGSLIDTATGLTENGDQSPWTNRFINWCNNNAFILINLWFLLFLCKSVWTLGAYRRIEKIRRNKSSQASPVWLSKVQELAEQLNIRQYIQLLESKIVKAPVVVGALKPVILVPVGLLAHLPPDQVELILLHELAHIRRKDYLVNILQVLIETTFFFNPALLWISSLVREARENCCDDIAVQVTNNKKGYINALLSFQEYYSNQVQVAPAFASGRKNHLLNRVVRIVHNNNASLHIREKFFLTIALLTAGFAGIAFSEKEQHTIKQLAGKAVNTIVTISSAGASGEKKPVPEKKMTKKEQVTPVNSVLTSNQSDMASISLNTTDTNIRVLRTNKVTLAPRPGLAARNYSIEKIQHKKDSIVLNRSAYAAEKFKLKKSLSEQILEDLVKEQVINDTAGVAFSLNNEELIINGKKQSSEVHNRIISKYVKGPKDRLNVSRAPSHFY